MQNRPSKFDSSALDRLYSARAHVEGRSRARRGEFEIRHGLQVSILGFTCFKVDKA
jgi:hypothetical protein